MSLEYATDKTGSANKQRVKRKLIPFKDAELVLGVSRFTLYRLLRQGVLESRRIGARHLLTADSVTTTTWSLNCILILIAKTNTPASAKKGCRRHERYHHDHQDSHADGFSGGSGVVGVEDHHHLDIFEG